MDHDRAADEELLRAFVAGDERSFTTLMRRHEDRVFAIALRITGDRSDALEAAQEAFIAVFRQARSFRGDSALSTWLYRVAVNACRDLMRKRRRAPLPDDEAVAARGGTAPGSVEDAAVARVDVARALAGLPEEYRDAVALHDLAGVPYEEIAAVTGAKLGTVKSRISRGRRMLAQSLEHGGAPEPSKG